MKKKLKNKFTKSNRECNHEFIKAWHFTFPRFLFNKPTCSCLSIDSHRYPYSFSLSAPTGLLVTGNWQMVTGNWLLPQLLGLLGTQRTTNVTVTLCAAIHVWKWVVLWVVRLGCKLYPDVTTSWATHSHTCANVGKTFLLRYSYFICTGPRSQRS